MVELAGHEETQVDPRVYGVEAGHPLGYPPPPSAVQKSPVVSTQTHYPLTGAKNAPHIH